MKSAPKLLPWFANRAHITEELATKLWRRARQEAREITGCMDSPDYHALTLDRFFSLLEAETSKDTSPEATPFAWIWRHHQRMSNYSLAAGFTVSRAWQDMLERMRLPLSS